MLWKLADNVKYEEDCEVRGCGEGWPLGDGGAARGSAGLRRPRAALRAPLAASPAGSAGGPCPKSPLCIFVGFFFLFSFGGADFYFSIFRFFIFFFFAESFELSN